MVAAAGGYLATRTFGLGLEALFVVMAAGLVAYGLVMLAVARRELGLVVPRRHAQAGKGIPHQGATDAAA